MVGTGRFELEPNCGREQGKAEREYWGSRRARFSRAGVRVRRRNPERSASRRGVEGSHARAPRTLLLARIRFATARQALGVLRGSAATKLCRYQQSSTF